MPHVDKFSRAPLSFRFVRAILRFFIFTFFDVRVNGAEKIPRENYLLVGNHLGWIDPFLVLAVFPAEPRIHFLGAEEAINEWWKGPIVRFFGGSIFVSRRAAWKGKAAFESALVVLKSGGVLALFPEGDSGPNEGELMPLKKGIGHFIVRGNRSILPMALSGTRELYWRKTIRVIIGEPFTVETRNIGRAMIAATVAQVAGHIRAILPHYSEPRGVVKRMRWLTSLLK